MNFKVGDTVGIKDVLSLASQDYSIHRAYYVGRSYMDDTLEISLIEKGLRVNEIKNYTYSEEMFYTRKALLTERL